MNIANNLPTRDGTETTPKLAAQDLLLVLAAAKNIIAALAPVDATSDANKPVSTAQAAAITSAINGLSATLTAAISAASTADRMRSNGTGTQPSSTISDFTEAVQDAVGAFLVAGSNITASYDDANNSLTLSGLASGGTFDPEATRDAIGAALIGLGNIGVAVNDAADTITITTSATVNSTDAALRDRATHTGNTPADSIVDGTTNKAYTAAEKTKLGGVAPNATANRTDSATDALIGAKENTGVAASLDTALLTLLRGGVATAGDNLAKLYALLGLKVPLNASNQIDPQYLPTYSAATMVEAVLNALPGRDTSVAQMPVAQPGGTWRAVTFTASGGGATITVLLSVTVNNTAVVSGVTIDGSQDSATLTLAPNPSSTSYTLPILRLVTGPKGAGGTANQGFWGNDGVVAESPRVTNYFAGMVSGSYTFEAQITVGGTVYKSTQFIIKKP